VKRLSRGALALALVSALFPAAPAAPKFDYHQQQSPPRPKPKWLKVIDQGKNDPRLKGYFTPAGVKLEIVADYPVVTNPVGMTFADDGTLFVLEWRPHNGPGFPEHREVVTYKDGNKRAFYTMKKKVKDVVKVLRDTRGKGVYDKSEVVLRDELPSSILLHDGWLYLSGRGTVRRYKQSKPGGPYDVKQTIARGFCGYHHHQVSGLTIGNDGWLYVTSGDDDNVVEGSDGSRATVLRTGAVFRCRPDGSKVQVFSIGYRNPYRDVAFDAAFNMFHADNDNEDGSKFTGCRLMHVAEGSDFGWRLYQGARCCRPDRVRGAVFGELAGKLPPLLKTGRGAPAGLLIYNDTRFPAKYRGLLYYPDVFRKLIRAYRVEPQGATFEVKEEFEFLRSNNPLFRPCQMVLGPDGAMYVCDWRTDSGGAGRLWGDNKHGRIYRLSWAGTGKEEPARPLRGLDSWAKIARLKDADLLKKLPNEDFSDRQRAQRELVRRGPKHRPALLKMLADDEQPLAARIAALGALESFWNKDVAKAFCAVLEDSEPDLRRLAAEGLSRNCARGDKAAGAALVEHLGDPEADVRRAAALAVGRIAAPGAADALVSAYKFDDGKDRYLTNGLIRAIERLGKPGLEKLTDLANSGVDRERDKTVAAFLALRTRPALPFLKDLLMNPHLRVAQRAGLVRSYCNYLFDPPISLGPMMDYLIKHSKEDVRVKRAGLEVLSCSGGRHDRRTRKWLVSLLDETDPALRRLLLQVVGETGLAEAAPRLLTWLADGSRPAAERQAVVQTLRVLKPRSAIPALKKLLGQGVKQPVALRTETLRTLDVIDPAAARVIARKLLAAGPGAVDLLRAAIGVLGAEKGGAKWIADRFLARKLPRELLAEVTEALRRHSATDDELAALLARVMKGGLLIPLDNKAEVRRIRQLVQTRGNAERGKKLYLNSKALACSRCHRMEGVGGSIGPDLTRLWETQSVPKILESLLDPSKEIKEGYQTYRAETTAGKIYTGLKISQTKERLILRDGNGVDVRIPAGKLEKLTVLKKSLMPDDVVKHLSLGEFLDLVAFLKSRTAQESLRGLARKPSK
jgi:putative membrane-bound dehydrogenase-like protein